MVFLHDMLPLCAGPVREFAVTATSQVPMGDGCSPLDRLTPAGQAHHLALLQELHRWLERGTPDTCSGVFDWDEDGDRWMRPYRYVYVCAKPRVGLWYSWFTDVAALRCWVQGLAPDALVNEEMVEWLRDIGMYDAVVTA